MNSKQHRETAIFFTLFVIFTFFLFGLTGTEATFFSYASNGKPNKPCVILDINFTISFKAFDANKKLVGSAVRTSDDQNITVMGSCGNTPQMGLRFENGSSWWFIFSNGKRTQVVELDQLIQFIPNVMFGSVTPSGNPASFDDPGTTEIGTVKTSYLCRSTTRVTYNPKVVITGNYTYDVTVTVNGIQVQAFQVKKGEFSSPTECDQDFTTTPEPTTSVEPTTTAETTSTTTVKSTTSTTTESANTTTESVNTTTTLEPTNTTRAPSSTTTETTTHLSSTTLEPSTTTSSGPSVNNYTVSDGNSTCIVLVGSIRIDIEYEAKTGEKNETETRVSEIEVPSKFKVTGNCKSSDTTQNMAISFFKGWVIDFTFKRDSEADLNSDEFAYGISNVTLRYVIDSGHFPDSSQPVGAVHYVVPDKEEDHSYPSKSSAEAGFYKCDSSVTMTLTDEVDVETKDLKFKAFSNDKDADFTGDADECSADDDSDDLVPILVGVILGALILIIIIFFLISRWRRRKRMQYETI